MGYGNQSDSSSKSQTETRGNREIRAAVPKVKQTGGMPDKNNRKHKKHKKEHETRAKYTNKKQV